MNHWLHTALRHLALVPPIGLIPLLALLVYAVLAVDGSAELFHCSRRP